MNGSWEEALLWSVLQVTLLGLVGCAWLIAERLLRAAVPSAQPTSVLVLSLGLTLLVFLPLPAWWNFSQHLPTLVSKGDTSAKVTADKPEMTVEDGSSTAPWKGLGFNQAAGTKIAGEIAKKDRESVTVSSARPTFTVQRFSRAIQLWLPRIVLAGGLVGLLRLFAALVGLRAYRHASRPIQDARCLELSDVVRAQLRCVRKFELRETASLASAATVGWRNPIVLLPLEWRDWTTEELKTVLAHELSHVKRDDYLWCLLGQCALAIHFYHPLMHWLFSRLRFEQEVRADAEAASIIGGPKQYVRILAKMALQQDERNVGWPARSFLPTRPILFRRIEMLRRFVSTSSGSAVARMTKRGMIALCFLLVGVGLAGLRGSWNSPPRLLAADPQGEANKDFTDLSYVPTICSSIIVIRPNAMSQDSSLAKLMEYWGAIRQQRSDSTYRDIKQVSILSLNSKAPPLELIEFIKPLDSDAVTKLTGAKYVEALAAIQGDEAGDIALKINANTVVVGSVQKIKEYVSSPKGNQAIASSKDWSKLRASPVLVFVDMPLMKAETLNDQRSNPTVAALEPLWNKTKQIVATVDISNASLWTQTLNAKNFKSKGLTVQASITPIQNSDTEKISKNTIVALALLEGAITSYSEGFLDKQEEQVRKLPKLFASSGLQLIQNTTFQAIGGELQASVQLPQESLDSIVAALPKPGEVSLMAREADANNLKQIGLALHNFHSVYGHFPAPITYGKDGKGGVPHSWRVDLLPFMEQTALYNEYRFDEPWDSEHNLKLSNIIPVCYKSVSKGTASPYCVLTGTPGECEKELFSTMFTTKKGMKLLDITDGTSNTIMVIEMENNEPWSKPVDVVYSPDKPLPKFGGLTPKGYHALFADGSVRFLSESIEEKLLRALITPRGGEVVTAP